jgi:alpha-1,2-mannosyltransferase
MLRLPSRYGPVRTSGAMSIHTDPVHTDPAGLAPAGLAGEPPGRGRPSARLPARPPARALAWAALAFGLSLTAYVADVTMHPLHFTFRFFDLNIYNHAGLLVRHAPATLYTWHFLPGNQYLYTPLAAAGFAVTSLLPWALLKWLMAAASFAAVPLTVWVTFGQLGWSGRRRQAAVLGVSAVALWMEPALVSMQQGQIELVLMALIAWDLCQPETRRWKGAGVGLAAAIKLVPLIFILYLVLAGKLRQAAVAAATFAATVLAGFVILPRESASFWLTGYFLHSGNFPAISLGSLRNQSLLALVLRVPGVTPPGTALWLAAAAAVGCLGLASAALLARSGQLAAGWIACGVTGVLLSPISWDNHWVWVIPMLALLTATAVQQTRWAARLACWAAAIALAAVFADWPDHIAGPGAFIPHGLLGFGFGPHPLTEIYHLHGFQLISWNAYVLAGLAVLALLVARAAATRKRPAGPAAAAGPPLLPRSSTPLPGAAARTG